MEEGFYAQLVFSDNYQEFTLSHGRLRSFRLHIGDESLMDCDGNPHVFDVVWFHSTGELVAAEVEEQLGTVLPYGLKLRRSTGRYLFLGYFTQKGIDDLLPHKGSIIKYLRELHTGGTL